MRGGNAGSARGAAASLLAETIATAREARATGIVVVRAGSACYGGAFVAACRRAAPTSRSRRGWTRRSGVGIDAEAWVRIKYPEAIYDEASDTWVSDAEVAAAPYTAFANCKAHRVGGRLTKACDLKT